MSGSLVLETTESAVGVVIHASGVLDMATGNDLDRYVRARLRPDTALVLDIAGVTLCDSTGLGSIVRLGRRARAMACRFSVRGPRRQVADIMAMTGIDQVIQVSETGAAAPLGEAQPLQASSS